MKTILLFALLLVPMVATSAELNIQVSNSPTDGEIVFQIYDTAESFGAFENPAKELRFQPNDTGKYTIADITPGTIAVVAYHDVNLNGELDSNFIGIPREPVYLSNDYRPKGPPRFERASFDIDDAQPVSLDVAFFKILGDIGQFGVGIGLVGSSIPYLDSNETPVQIIPSLTYIGDRLQVFGPNISFNLTTLYKVQLALSATYRFEAYEEDDSDILQGLGDREATLLAGLSLQYDLPQGFEVGFEYQQDVLNNIGGGIANLSLSRGFQYKIARLRPEVSLNWLDAQISNHEFGVPLAFATDTRVDYVPGSTLSVGVAVGSMFELSEKWQLFINTGVNFLPDEITDSPLVSDDIVLSLISVVSYVF